MLCHKKQTYTGVYKPKRRTQMCFIQFDRHYINVLCFLSALVWYHVPHKHTTHPTYGLHLVTLVLKFLWSLYETSTAVMCRQLSTVEHVFLCQMWLKCCKIVSHWLFPTPVIHTDLKYWFAGESQKVRGVNVDWHERGREHSVSLSWR